VQSCGNVVIVRFLRRLIACRDVGADGLISCASLSLLRSLACLSILAIVIALAGFAR
jgi:hypothetical protein